MSTAISINKLRFSYPNSSKPVLTIPSWTVNEGETVFIHGPSGSGKSTLLKLLAGILYCQQGELQVSGQPLHQMSERARDHFRARHIGFVFQQLNLIPYLSVLDNVRLGAYFSDHNSKTAEQLLQELGLDTLLFQQAAAQLSIGQQQRVAIARALINQASLIIVDEPTSALDTDNRDSFMALLLSQVRQRKASLLFVSHDRSLDQHFDCSISLQDLNTAEGL